MLTDKDKNSTIEDYGQVVLGNGKEQGKITQNIFSSVHNKKRRRSGLRRGFLSCAIEKIGKLFGVVI